MGSPAVTEIVAAGIRRSPRAVLLRVSRDVLNDLGPVPVSVAAPLLGVSEPTVRSWTRRGLLIYADGHDSGLDVGRLYEVIALVRELRSTGQTHDLLNKVWDRLADNAVLERPDLRDSLAQMRRGDGIPTDVDELERDLGIADQWRVGEAHQAPMLRRGRRFSSLGPCKGRCRGAVGGTLRPGRRGVGPSPRPGSWTAA